MTKTLAGSALIFTMAIAGFVLLCSATVQAQIQFEEGYHPAPLGNDTLCFRYDIRAGDTLQYEIEALDSVMIEGQPTIRKHRQEAWLVICDSVDAGHRIWLQQRLIRIRETQIADYDTVQRSTSPWMNRKAYRIIDTLGTRLRSWSDTTLPKAIAPGGPFAPSLLPDLSQSCGRQNESWFVQDTALLVENGLPEPVLTHSTLWRVLDKVDTLGTTYRQIQYSSTGTGTVAIDADGANLSLLGVLNGFGKISFRKGLDVPYHIYSMSENKLTFERPNGVTRTGMHKTMQDAQLLRIGSPKASRRLGPYGRSIFDTSAKKNR